MKNAKKQTLKCKRKKQFGTLEEMADFIKKNHIRDFDSEFSEKHQVYILRY